jgi:hypothetical protein
MTSKAIKTKVKTRDNGAVIQSDTDDTAGFEVMVGDSITIDIVDSLDNPVVSNNGTITYTITIQSNAVGENYKHTCRIRVD